jgi:hypothetical protein
MRIIQILESASVGGMGTSSVATAPGKAGKMIKRQDNILAAEVAPPGWEKTVKSMKKHKEIDNPFALAWSMKNKGYKSHKKESIKEGGVKEILMDLRTMSDEEFQSTYKMSKMQARSKLKEKPVEENKKGVRAVKHTVKPRNFVAKNAVQSGAGAHKDKKKAQKQGDTKHKNKEPAYESRLWAALDRRIIK